MIKSINFELLVFRLLPTFLRGTKNVSWLKSLLSPLQSLNASFVSYSEQQKLKAEYNTQSIVLEKVIKEAFNITNVLVVNNFDSTVSNLIGSVVLNPTNPNIGFLENNERGFDVGYLQNITPSLSYNFYIHVDSSFINEVGLAAFVDQLKVYNTRFLIIKDL